MRTFESLLLFLCFAAASVVAQTAAEMKTAGEAERSAAAAYRSGDMKTFLSQMGIANANRPNHPRLIYNLGVAHTKNGDPDKAFSAFGRLAKMGMGYRIENDEDLRSLAADRRFEALRAAFEANRRPTNASVRSFTLHAKDLIAESVAYDPRSRNFFVGSVHRRKILRIAQDGSEKEFSSPADGLWSVLGIKVDVKRGVLWAATSAVPQMEGFSTDLKGRSGLFKYDTGTGKLLGKFLLPDDRVHMLGDVLVAGDGSVFATDSVSPRVFRFVPGTEKLEEFLTSDRFVSLQGLTFGRGQNELFVADYSKGIFRVDISTKHVVQLSPAADITLLGIDGLYFYDGGLIAIQNGVNPNRVIALEIDGDRIVRAKVLESNHQDFLEPTLGTIIGHEFHFVANSQWPLVNEKAELTIDKLRQPVILKLDLRKALAAR